MIAIGLYHKGRIGFGMQALDESVHAQDGSPTSDIQDDFVFEKVFAIVYSIAVGLRADFIFLLYV